MSPTIDIINNMAQELHATTKSKGFWDGHFSFAEKVALIHSELSELLECHRDGTGTQPCEKLYNQDLEPCAQITKLEEEAADVIIRVLDLAAYMNWNIGNAIIKKANYNQSRPYKHGKNY